MAEKNIESLEEELQKKQQVIRNLFAKINELQKEGMKKNARIEEVEQALRKMQAQLIDLSERIAELTKPPSPIGTFCAPDTDGTAIILFSGREMRVHVDSRLKIGELRRGQKVILNDAMVVVDARPYEDQGEIARLKEVLDKQRVIVTLRHDEEHVVRLADSVKSESLRIGDQLLCDARTGFVLDVLPRSEAADLLLEEVPNVTYEMIGGLHTAIKKIKQIIEFPFLYPELYAKYRREAPKGVLLYGPPGCGKTLIAKAVVSSIADRLRKTSGKDIRGYLIHIKGPQLLNKYVGETERKIREIFLRAREKASKENPVVVFFDEADTMFRTRGTGISSDVEMWSVGQFLPELDGMEALHNVIVILATNRPELIDPAILRPGRIDNKIKVPRPERNDAKEIFRIYLDGLPFSKKYSDPAHRLFKPEYQKLNGDTSAIAEYIVEKAVRRLWATDDYRYKDNDGNEKTADNRIIEVTYDDGMKEILYLKDLVSGALIADIVRRAKDVAIERERVAREREGREGRGGN